MNGLLTASIQVGLLPNSNHQQVPFAYRMYLKDDEKGNALLLYMNLLSLLIYSDRVETERPLREFYRISSAGDSVLRSL